MAVGKGVERVMRGECSLPHFLVLTLHDTTLARVYILWSVVGRRVMRGADTCMHVQKHKQSGMYAAKRTHIKLITFGNRKERFPSLAIKKRPKTKTKKALWQHETITLLDYYALAGVDN